MWSMIDINGHLRHSAYADFAAQARVNILEKMGFSKELFRLHIGPILFREELVYLKEIRMNDYVEVSCELVKCNEDASRYTLQSVVYRKSDGVKAAEINVDGAWLDLNNRKLTAIPEIMKTTFLNMPKANGFRVEVMSY
ncbi:MAG: thioesterase [Pseudopedobacter saltans]|uniref:Thioesterase n=1 Tax=Pseudopedobacter saltans TaxID=151895 RepID=A0A2W5F3Z9_9SPHI|nr:MAG: thioesterase [Pseudopedobacter saltans]